MQWALRGGHVADFALWLRRYVRGTYWARYPLTPAGADSGRPRQVTGTPAPVTAEPQNSRSSLLSTPTLLTLGHKAGRKSPVGGTLPFQMAAPPPSTLAVQANRSPLSPGARISTSGAPHQQKVASLRLEIRREASIFPAARPWRRRRWRTWSTNNIDQGTMLTDDGRNNRPRRTPVPG